MATEAPSGSFFTFSIAAVRRSIERLADRRCHEHLPGYLALLRGGAAQGPVEGGTILISNFYREYMRVEGLPEGRPFLQPFRSKGKGVKTSNRNTSGSYAGSSIREGMPFSHAVEILPAANIKNDTYQLKQGHAQVVLSRMLSGNRVPAIALAGFLFRDYALSLSAQDPKEIIEVLRAWLRLNATNDPDGVIFDTLFEDDADNYKFDDLVAYGEGNA